MLHDKAQTLGMDEVRLVTKLLNAIIRDDLYVAVFDAVMGGFGSGRPSGSGRETIESCRSINVNRLHREGCLRPGWVGRWQWTLDDEKVASFNLRVEDHRLHLSYGVRICCWEDVAETVRVLRIACRFGGARPYLTCPGVMNGVTCSRRVVKLHALGTIFFVGIATVWGM